MTPDHTAVATFVDVLEDRAARQPARRGFTFLVDGERQEAHLSYGELQRRARTIAAELARLELPGERAILLYPPGLAYIEAFFGCLYAGVIAVPAYPPDPTALARTLPRLQAIAEDARATVVLSTEALRSVGVSLLGQTAAFQRARWIATDALSPELADRWRPAAPSSVAFLQYTSGSTAEPKGVMVSHANLLDNSQRIYEAFGHSEAGQGVIWLPPYHDMGLIGGILQPLFAGMPVTLMSPLHFLQRPVRWLEAISRYRATTSGGPNFAYELCARKVTPAELDRLDLARWQVAFNGAEPLRPETLRRFAATFERAGFRAAAFHPCYGLAEATLIVTGGDPRTAPMVRGFDARGLAEGRVAPARGDGTRELVACGRAVAGEVAIVEPATGRAGRADEVGEVWVSGSGVAGGYFERADETAVTFRAFRSDRTGPYLRTGDLGFLHEGQLFLVGRRKDLIIIHGANHYPDDLERSIEAHPGVRPGCGAAFSVDVAGEERLVGVFEIDPAHHARAGELARAIRRTVLDRHDLAAHEIVLIKSRTISKTSSGKIQRSACRAAYLAGQLEVIATSLGTPAAPADRARSAMLASPTPAARTPAAPMPAGGALRTAAAIRTWLVERMAARTGLEPGEIDVHSPLAHLGLSSLQAVELSGELEIALGRRLPPTLVYEHPTIERLARHLGAGPAAPLQASVDAGDRLEPIAIVGIGCRFPGAHGPDAFWRLLRDGVDAVSSIPAEREQLCPAFAATATRSGGFLGDVEQFDPQLYKISLREAAAMDPQQRLVLDVARDALDDAGQPVDALAGSSTGVFLGISSSDYGRRHMGVPDVYDVTGNALSIAANRLSYVLDLRGTSMAIDTACSSSLAAIHHACQSVRSGESELALAGGVNLVLAPEVTESLAAAGFLARDGRCKAFDAAADGYVRGEGCGIVVLKRLSKARADGDRVYAVIPGSAINNDGRSNGLTAPSGKAQASVIRRAYASAGVDPAGVQYVEAHGTGTPLGDPIEARALAEVVSPGGAREVACRVGSVKTNLGHLEAAAGVAGLIKTALALHHQELPATLHYRAPNPKIAFDELRLAVQAARTPWPRGARAAVAGVSSFGFGGTNVHVVLAAAPESPAEAARVVLAAAPEVLPETAHVVLAAAPEVPPETARVAYVLPISAHSPEALAQAARSYADVVAAEPRWADVCAGAATRRAHLEHRAAVIASSGADAAAALRRFAVGERPPAIAVGRQAGGRPAALVFVFSGQGNQWPGMGRELFEREPVFRAAIEACDRWVGALAGWSIRDQLAAADDRATTTDVAQPVLFAIQTALVALWRHWGIVPDAVVGHSMGEVAAAHAAGALSLRDAIAIIVQRGRVMQRAHGRGKMAILELSAEEAAAALGDGADRLTIAAENSPRETVIAGEPVALAELCGALAARGIAARELPGNHAFHSADMDPLQHELATAIAEVAPMPAAIRFVSTVTGAAVDGSDLGAAYWARQLRAPVRFHQAIQSLGGSGHAHYMELGTSVLARSIVDSHRAGRAGAASAADDAVAIGSLRRTGSEQEAMMRSVAALYAHGHSIDWSTVYPGAARFIALPRTARMPVRCWVDAQVNGHAYAIDRAARAEHPLLGRRVPLAGQLDRVWHQRIDLRSAEYLKDHRFAGAIVLPAAAFLELALAAVAEDAGPGPRALTEIRIDRPLILAEGASPVVQVVIGRDATGQARFQIFSRPGAANDASDAAALWTLHATGAIRAVADAATAPDTATVDLAAIRERCREAIPAASFYAGLERRGLGYGPSFRGVEQVWRGSGEVLARVRMPAGLDRGRYQLHPAIVDACAQIVAAIDPDDRPFLPVAAAEVRLWSTAREIVWSHARLASAAAPGDRGVFDLALLDDGGRPVAEIRGLRIQYVDEASALAGSPERWLYDIEWQPKPLQRRLPQARPPATWLLFTDRSGVGDALAARLTASGERCLCVEPGQVFERLAADRFRIDPASAEHVAQVFDSLGPDGDGRSLRGVVHLWSLDLDTEADVGALERARRLTVESAVAAIKALAIQSRIESPRIWLVTRGAQPIAESPPARSLLPATLWGLGRTVVQEHPELFGGLVDLEPGAAPEAMARQLHRELASSDGEEQIAFRGDARFVARLRRATVAAPRPGARCRADGAYLVTGGAGALGLLVARGLAEQGARRIILMSRTALPARAEWARISADSRVGAQIASIRRLESLGVAVDLANVDVGDEAQLAAFLARYRAEAWPPIRGVVHVAGVLGDRTLVNLDPALLAEVFRAKVHGAWLLDRAFADQPLEFFAMFSSIAAVLGSAGQANYAAANAFLDALAHDRRCRDQPALSIDWGPWADVGVATHGGRGDRLARGGTASIDPELGLELFRRLLHGDATQVAVMAVDWPRFARTYARLAGSPFLSRLIGAPPETARDAGAPAASTRDAIAAAAPSDRESLVIALLAKEIAAAVGAAATPLRADQRLDQLGVDSLMGIELRTRLEQELGISIPMDALLSAPTIAQLAGLLLGRIGGAPAPSAPALPAAPEVIVIRAGSRVPMFCIHPGALDTDCYGALAEQLGEAQPFYSVRLAQLESSYWVGEGAAPIQTSIEELAASCIAAIRAVQLDGPYILSGWSLGGVIALEVTRQLERAGQRVALLAVFDSPTPREGPVPDEDETRLAGAFASYLGARQGHVFPAPNGDWHELDLDARLSRILEWAKRATVLAPGAELGQLRSLMTAYARGLRASVQHLVGYRPEPCVAPIVYFRAIEVLGSYGQAFPDPSAQWHRWTSRPLTIVETPGDHYTMFLPPNAGTLAAKLSPFLPAQDLPS